MQIVIDQLSNPLITGLLGPLVVGLVIWKLGKREQDNRIKSDAIRDLMTYRADFSSREFLRSLNKVSITFHNNDEIRTQIRTLYESISLPGMEEKQINRKIVGLIYTLCQKNGFDRITEYDIDQAFPESKQAPEASQSPVSVVARNA